MIAKNRQSLGFGLAAVLAFCMAGYASADEGDPPTRVARLAYAEGSVSFLPGGTQDWVAATVNRPLTTGDQLWADRDSRAELQLDGSLLRLAGSTAVSLLNLSDNVTQIQLSSGTLLIRVRRLDDDETYEIDAPNLAFTILRPGLYRLSVEASGATTAVQVRSGQGEVTGGGTAYMVQAGENNVYSGANELTEYALSSPPSEEPFDAWSAGRDDRLEHSESARYVSPDVVGYQDLDDQGTWQPTPDYGSVWFPSRVEPGWAPYHYGHWSYIAPWGYTWVDDQPWGFAPFHYGRWIFVRGAWGWIPAPPRPLFGAYVRPVYAPALVAWVGVGAGVAWFALGPREVYVPCYPVSRRYVNDINVSNTTVNTTVINNVYNTTIINNKTVNVTNVRYVNRDVPGAVAAIPSRAFITAQPVSRNLVKVDPRALASAPVHALAPADVPTKQAVLGSARIVAVKPPASVQTRAIVARTPPPPPPPPFEKRVEAIRANAGKPLSVTQVRQIQTSDTPRSAPVRIAPAATPVPSKALSQRPAAPSPAAPKADLRPAAPVASVEGNRSPAVAARPPAVAPPPPAVAARPPAVAVHPNELPAVPKPASPNVANSALEREHLQQQQQLHAQQEQERARVQQQQELAHQELERQQAEAARKQQLALQQQQQAQQLAQQQGIARQQEAERQKAQQQQELARAQQADEARRQQIELQHQQQTQQLAQQHALQQQQLLQRQQQERQLQESQTKPANRKVGPPNSK